MRGASAALFANPEGSPPGANVPCTPTAERQRPVVLIPGTAEAMSFNLHALSPFLANQGFCVCALNYWRAGFVTLYTALPNGRARLRVFSPAGEQQLIGAPSIRERRRPTPGDVRYDILVTKYDQVITPYRRSFLDGASAWTVQQGCPLDLSEHLALVTSPRAMTKVANLLDGGARRLHLPFPGSGPVGAGDREWSLGSERPPQLR